MRHCIEVKCIEFDEDGHTIWIQGLGGTVLRLKTFDGKITSKRCKTSPSVHGDAVIKGDVEICIPVDA